MVVGLISGSSPLRRAWDAVDRDVLTSFLRELLDEEPRSRAELVRAIAVKFGDRRIFPELRAIALAFHFDDGWEIDAETLDRYVGKYQYPGIGVLTVRRDGSTRTLKVTLGSRPSA